MHGHCASLPPGCPVLRRRNLLSLARWWPTAAGLTGSYPRIYPETRRCALLVGCCLAHWGTWVWGGGDLLPGSGASTSTGHFRPGGAGGRSAQRGGRGILPRQWGAIFLREPGAPAWGGRGVLPRGRSESPARPRGGHLLQNGAHRPGGDGESCPGGVRSLLPGQWGAIFFREPGAPARGGRGVLPRGCLESPARPRGGHLLQRTGRTGLGGTGSLA